MEARPLDLLPVETLRWFAPALDRLRGLREEADPRLRTFFGPGAPILLARAPGRLDVMGGIADYSGSLVLEMPLARSTWAALQAQPEPFLDLATTRDGAWHFFRMDLASLRSGPLATPEGLARWFAERIEDGWAAYVAGVLHYCLRERGAALPQAGGVRMLIGSDVPEGKGVSSSAALEVAALSVLAAHYGFQMTPEEIAVACQWAENHVVGAPCGIMDQMTSACGRQDRLLRLLCQPGRIEGHVAVPQGYRFYGIDSGIRHAVSGADYATVRTAAFMGYRILADAAGGDEIADARWSGYLANITPAELSDGLLEALPEHMPGDTFIERYGGIADTVTEVLPDRLYPVRAATVHPILEHDRVRRFAGLLETLSEDPEAAVAMGELMYASHESYDACGLGSDGTDRLIAMVAEAGPEAGLFGAKITGGGSGGTVAILGKDSAEAAVRALAAAYAEETGRSPEVFADSGPGAAETGVARIDPAAVAHGKTMSRAWPVS